jgi:hypothetical protein
MPLEVTFEHVNDELSLPMFRPHPAGSVGGGL